MIGMMDNGFRFAPIDRHVERIDDELFAHVISHCPSDNSSAIDIEDDRKEEKAGPRRYVRDIGNPELIWLACSEVTIDEIRRGLRFAITHGCRDPLAPRSAVAVAFAHQTGNAFIAGTNPFVLPRRAPKTGHLRALQNRPEVGGHFKTGQ